MNSRYNFARGSLTILFLLSSVFLNPAFALQTDPPGHTDPSAKPGDVDPFAQSSQTPRSANDERILVYRLRHADGRLACEVLATILRKELGAVSLDENTNALIVMAKTDGHAKVKEFLEKLDQPNPLYQDRSLLGSVNFIVKMIMEADDGDWSQHAAKPDEDTLLILQDIYRENLVNPFKDPRVVTSSVIRVNPFRKAPQSGSGKIQSESSTSQNTGRLKISGQVAEQLGGEIYSLNCNIEVELVVSVPNSDTNPQGGGGGGVSAAAGSPSDASIRVIRSSIEADTTLVSHHPVLLSLNSIEGKNCLIVVEVRRTK